MSSSLIADSKRMSRNLIADSDHIYGIVAIPNVLNIVH